MTVSKIQIRPWKSIFKGGKLSENLSFGTPEKRAVTGSTKNEASGKTGTRAEAKGSGSVEKKAVTGSTQAKMPPRGVRNTAMGKNMSPSDQRQEDETPFEAGGKNPKLEAFRKRILARQKALKEEHMFDGDQDNQETMEFDPEDIGVGEDTGEGMEAPEEMEGAEDAEGGDADAEEAELRQNAIDFLKGLDEDDLEALMDEVEADDEDEDAEGSEDADEEGAEDEESDEDESEDEGADKE